MPRQQVTLPLLPHQALAAWWSNALTMWEISLAAPQVIAHRTSRMARAGSSPSARDRKEFIRMGQEKAEAFGESVFAMGIRLWQAQQGAATSLSSLVRLGMAPVHRRVTANARRLGRAR